MAVTVLELPKMGDILNRGVDPDRYPIKNLEIIHRVWKFIYNTKLRVLGSRDEMFTRGPGVLSKHRETREWQEMFLELKSKPASHDMRMGELAMFTAATLIFDGPRILKLDGVAEEALVNTSLSIEPDDYTQPYDTIVVEIPEKISESNVFVEDGVQLKPKWCVVHKQGSSTIQAITFFNDSVIFVNSIHKRSNEHTIEDIINGIAVGQDTRANANCLRAALNAILIMDSNGCQMATGLNPIRDLDKLRRKSGKAGKRFLTVAEEFAKNREYYTISQDISLYSRSEHVESDGEGNPVRPHWRRGHWRMQPFGEGRSQRKRIRIPPVLVNSSQFLGDGTTTRVVYRA